MAVKTLEYLLSLKYEYEAFKFDLDKEEEREKLLNKEAYYLENVEELAQLKPLQIEIVNILKTKSSNPIYLQACHISFLSKDDKLIDSTLEIVCSDEINIDLNETLSLLPEVNQKHIIEKLLKIDNKKSNSYAGIIIRDNGYKEYAKHYIEEDTVKSTIDPSLSYAILCRLGDEDDKKHVENIFINTKHELKKEDMVVELLFAKSQVALNYAKEINDTKSLLVVPFISSKEDYKIFINHLPKDIDDNDEIDFFGLRLFWYGNPNLMPWYISMLDNKDACMMFHTSLLDFFGQSDNEMTEGYNFFNTLSEFEDKFSEQYKDIYTDEDIYSQKYEQAFDSMALNLQKEIKIFWNSKIEYIKNTINFNQRYYGNEAFNLVDIFAENIYSPPRANLSEGYILTMLLTGKYFPLDLNTSYAKQIQQSKDILGWLIDNKEKHPIGQWYYWGIAC